MNTGDVEVDLTVPLRRVVGLDISLTATGIASSLGWSRVVGRSDITTAPLLIRMAAVSELADSILRHTGRPELAVVEVPAYRALGGGVLERSLLWGLVVRGLISREIPVAEVYNNTRMKYATGKGLASKGAIVDAVARRYPRYLTGGNDNLADAIVLCAMGCDWLGHPLARVPKAHRAALDAVSWPHIESLSGERAGVVPTGTPPASGAVRP